MSAILAVLLMLSGALFLPLALAQHPPSAMGASPQTIVKTSAQYPVGTIFTVDLTITNVAGLYTWGAGFYFNPVSLQLNSVVEGPFLKSAGTTLFLGGAIDNVAGFYTTAGCTLVGSNPGATGSGVLMTATFQTKTTYTGTLPGTAVQTMGLTVNPSDNSAVSLLDPNGNDITPPESALQNGTITITVVQAPPTAIFSITSPPSPPYYVNDVLTFDASASLPGSDGMNPTPIVSYMWNFGDGNITTTAGPIVTHAYTSAGPEHVTLTVMDTIGQTGTAPKDISIIVKPTGSIVDVFTQPYRYIDPITIQPVPQGKGLGQMAELFRPGDLVNVYVVTSYNGDPVQNQMVTIQVLDNQGNTVLAGVALTGALGLGELDFRIPWPCTGPEPEFGTWTVIATWEIGNATGSTTKTDTLTFNIGWGVWSSDLQVGGPYHVGDTVQIKYTLHNDYQEVVTVYNTITVYDDLMVPVGFTVVQVSVPAASAISVGPISIALPKWTFVGAGTVKADELTQLPSAMGIAWGPEQVAGFVILHTTNPQDP